MSPTARSATRTAKLSTSPRAAKSSNPAWASRALFSISRRYPDRPVLGVGALIFQDNKILLVERAGEPLKGWWSLPGGVVETGETLETALRREVREETGLEVGDLRFVEVFERIMPDASGKAEYHYVLIDYMCSPTGGELRAGDDASRVAWVSEEELAGMRITEGTPGVIAKGFWLLTEH